MRFIPYCFFNSMISFFSRKPHTYNRSFNVTIQEFTATFERILQRDWLSLCSNNESYINESYELGADIGTCVDDNLDENQRETIQNVSFWLQGVCKLIIGIIGIVSNVAAIPTLCSRKMKSIFNKLLICLLTLHTIYISGAILTQIMWPDWERPKDAWFIVLFSYVLYPLEPLMLYASTLITTLLARQRYLAIRHPIEYWNSNITVNPCIYAMKSLAFVLVVSGLFTVPLFFETSLGYTRVGEIKDINETQFQYVSMLSLEYSKLVKFN